jgi:hypothetical protein
LKSVDQTTTSIVFEEGQVADVVFQEVAAVVDVVVADLERS